MKRTWELEELIETFSLSVEEIRLWHGKEEVGQVGLAVLLKFFQQEGRFPYYGAEVPQSVVNFIAGQLGIPAERYKQYVHSGRTATRDRTAIREYFQVREVNPDDLAELARWIAVHPERLQEADEDHWLAVGRSYLRASQVELPTPEQLRRFVRSGLYQRENEWYEHTYQQLSIETRERLDALLESPNEVTVDETSWSKFATLKGDPAGASLKSILEAGHKLRLLRSIQLPSDLFSNVGIKYLQTYSQRAALDAPSDMVQHVAAVRYTLLSAFCWQRQVELTDHLIELLIQIIHKIGVRADYKVERAMLSDLKRVHGKTGLLFRIAEAVLSNPDGAAADVIYPVASEETLRELVEEARQGNPTYQERVYQVMRGSYSTHYRRMLGVILDLLAFRSNNKVFRPVLDGLELVKRYLGSKRQHYPEQADVPLQGVVRPMWMSMVIEFSPNGEERVNRINYELCTLWMLRERLRATEIWVEGSSKYGNPDHVLPVDFLEHRTEYYQFLDQPVSAEDFIGGLQGKLTEALAMLNAGLPSNTRVKVRDNGWIVLSPLLAQAEPSGLRHLKDEIGRQWGMTSLLDVLKEADLRTGFSGSFKTLASRQELDDQILQRRLLLCLFGLGTNTGIKQISQSNGRDNYDELLHVRRYFIAKQALRGANAHLVNATFAIRQPALWGEGNVACASDSRKFGVRGENLKSEWHIRYRGRGVMIYWHVERNALAIYSQLKAPSSSEVSSMIEGVLRHATEMQVSKNYVDSHGQSELAFAFCHLLGFELLPRLKGIHTQKLYRPSAMPADDHRNLQPILTRPIQWELIAQQYEPMIQYAVALKLGTADAETILRRFGQTDVQHPVQQALAELGKAVKTIFLCHYLHSEGLRREIHEGLNVIESWNSANLFIGYGKTGEFTGRRLADQEVSMLALQLLQNSLIYVNTLMLQQVLRQPHWERVMTDADWRGLTALFYGHINPYGFFDLDMSQRLALDAA